MIGGTEDPRRCASLQDELTELALGILDGRSRSEVLDHVGSCPRCAATLERLADAADSVLLLAPEVEPPLGFELRLAAKLQAPAEDHSPKRFRPARVLGAVAAVAAVLALLGFGLGSLVAPRAHHNPVEAANVRSATLTSGGHALGQVTVSAGGPAWVFMTINKDGWSGTVKCQVVLAGGKVQTVGVFKLSGGYGAWGAPLAAPADTVRSARLVALDGTTIASARLSA